ncbi:caspase-3-like isoform X2 [Ostrea edulis]|nr:caspase-3-like isoform X2 [Ostrea edulis]
MEIKRNSRLDARVVQAPNYMRIGDQSMQFHPRQYHKPTYHSQQSLEIDGDVMSMEEDSPHLVNDDSRFLSEGVKPYIEPASLSFGPYNSGIKAKTNTSRRPQEVPYIDIPSSVFHDTEYKMDHRKRGIALIINNMNYADVRQRPEREESIHDASAMENLLEHLMFTPVTQRMGHKNMVVNDVSSKRLEELIQDVTNPALNDFSDCDCFLMVVLSYGIDGSIMCCEGERDKLIPVEEVVAQFKADKCPSLAMKPKLFFMQLCPAFTYNIADSVGRSGPTSMEPEVRKIPTDSDILVQISTLPGTYGWYEDDNALSWYIQGLKDTLQKNCYDPLRQGQRSREINDILLHVNRLYISKLREQGICPSRHYSAPAITSTLTKDLYFLPKGIEAT